MTDELVGAEADRLPLEAVVADPLDVLLGHHPARAAHQRSVERHEVRPGLAQLKADAVRIDDHDLAHLVVEDLRALGAMKAELHVLGGEGVAVVELESLAQLELVGELVRAHRPRLGQARRHQIAGHRLHERVVDRVEHPERGEPLELSRIEPHGRERHVQRPAHLAFRLGLGGGVVDETAGEQRAQQEDAAQSEGSVDVHGRQITPAVLRRRRSLSPSDSHSA